TLGWSRLALPEEAGGAGYGLAEAALLFQEIGRSVAPGPWLGSGLAAGALAGGPARGGGGAGARAVAWAGAPPPRPRRSAGPPRAARRHSRGRCPRRRDRRPRGP